MRYLKWLGLVSALLLIVSCFMPWVFIESGSITVSGIDARGTNYGKPAYFHFVMTGFFLFFSLVPRVWAKRANLLVTALNLGWAVRNFFMISSCEAGDCPIKKPGLYFVLFASLLMLVAALFPDMKLPENKKENPDS